jgi:ribulose-phosphate 3-epimerase
MSISPLIAASLLSGDLGRLADEVVSVDQAGADWIHFDVMDGHFLPTLTVGPPVIKALRSISRKPFDCHLMVAPADPLLTAIAQAGADIITVHAEATPHLDGSLQTIRGLGKKAGVALGPGTCELGIGQLLDRLDLILVLTVYPGEDDQISSGAVLDKVRRVKAMVGTRPIHLEVEGGITADNASRLVAAGASVLVAGSAIFSGRHKGRARRIAALRASSLSVEQA